MGSKDALQKKQFSDAIKNVTSPFAFIEMAKVAGKFQIFSRHQSKIRPNPNVLPESKSLGREANMHIWICE